MKGTEYPTLIRMLYINDCVARGKKLTELQIMKLSRISY